MDYIVCGKNRLYGELPVYGAKNCELALLGASVLTAEEITLRNCPDIVDVENMLALLESMGKRVVRKQGSVSISGDVTTSVPKERSKLLRGSGLVLGSLVSAFGEAFLPATGGCAIGSRPIDIHLDGLRSMHVSVTESSEGVHCVGTPKGCDYVLRFASVGATENLLCAAALAKGETVLHNCAKEPEVVALEEMLVQMGAKLNGIGTSDITICGVKKLHGTDFDVIPDRIVTSTYLACVAAAGGELTVTNCCPKHIKAFLNVLCGRFDVKEYTDAVTLKACGKPSDYGSVTTAPYPAFPTDVQQILLSLCAQSDGGVSVITENLFENRLLHNATQLNKMGADVSVVGRSARIKGQHLHGANVVAKDLRGGAALVVAALGAEGRTVIEKSEHILRGYDCLAENLRTVGADILIRQ